jgi:uncharacterized protein YbdZ (MbtH family)
MELTISQYNNIIDDCRKIFISKNKDYGNSWREFRPSSLTDQIYIKAQRIRNIELTNKNSVGDSISSEMKSIINYGIIALIQLDIFPSQDEITSNDLLALYDSKVSITQALMQAKNSDYGEIWRDMRPTSFTDMILVKLLRIKQIEDNQGATELSEGVDANYQDIINYAVFALIRMQE